jgi:hypothetical protein
MSSGGIAQLVAIGAQDANLTGDPEITFFQSSYKRHVNFSRVTDLQVIQGNPSPGSMSTVKFDRKGDLLNYVYVTAVDTIHSNVISVQDWRDVIDHVELYIGGQLIDSQTSEFCELIAIDLMAQNLTMSSAGGHHDGAGRQSEFYPLRFFFNGSVTSALPLAALQLHEVEIRIYWSSRWYEPISSNNNKSMLPQKGVQMEVHANYIFLDDTERAKLTRKPISMLITQVQTLFASNTCVQELAFNHPVKYLASPQTPYNQDIEIDSNGNYIDPVNKNGLCDLHTRVKLQINGEDIGDFKYAVPHFTSVMSYYHCPFDNGNYETHFMYPFCIDTSRHQPTGTLNFSRLDSARLITDNKPISATIYAVNYNILKIERGMAGLMYAN